jgi:hypothetical protein
MNANGRHGERVPAGEIQNFKNGKIAGILNKTHEELA